MSVTSVLAAISMRRHYLGIILYFSLSAQALPAWGETGQKPPETVVRIVVESRVSLLDERTMTTAIHVLQRTPFTGLIIDDKGHVVSYVGMRWWPQFGLKRAKIVVETQDGRTFPAEIVGIDERISLAVLEARTVKMRFQGFHPFPADGQLRFLNLGREDWRSATPFLLKLERPPLTAECEVRVSGLGKAREGWEGGVILDKDAKVLGLITGAREYPFTKAISVWEVLPSEVIRESVGQILKTRADIKSGWLGVFFDTEKSSPAVIKALAEGSPAEKAGLQPGDAILKIKDQPVPDFARVVDIIRWAGPGQTTTMTIQRDNQVQDISVVLSQRRDKLPAMQWTFDLPPTWDASGMPVKPRIVPALPPLPFQLGFELDPLPEKLASFFKCPDNRGLLVRDVAPESLAEKAGFKVGDVLIRINDTPVGAPVDMQRSLVGGPGSVCIIQYVRDGRVQKAKLVLP
jgi:serine protease Do